MDDNSDGLIGLVALIVIGLVFVCGGFVIWMIWQALEYAAANPDEMKEIAKWLGLIITAPIWVPARLVLLLMRDLAVHDWQSTWPERDMIVLWVIGVPLAGLALFVVLMPLVYAAHTGLALLYFAAVLGSYFYLYFMRPPQHPNWPIFLATEEQMLLDIRSAVALRRYRFRLWLFTQRQAIERLFRRGGEASESDIG